MRRLPWIVAIVCGFGLGAWQFGLDFVWHLVFGWISFLRRVLPSMTWDPASVSVGAVALVLFTIVLHGVGKRALRAFPKTRAVKWRVKWTACLTALVITMFSAGTAAVGMTHQIAWLCTSGGPSHVDHVHGHNPRYALKDMGMSIEYYMEVYRGSAAKARRGPLQSWQTYLLIPYHSLRRFDWKQSWDSDHNIKYFRCAPSVYINPDFGDQAFDENGLGLSHYAANAELGDRGLRPGSSNLIHIGQVSSNFQPWGKPGCRRDPGLGLNTSNGFGAARRKPVQFLMADGSVREFDPDTDPDVLKSLSRPHDELRGP